MNTPAHIKRPMADLLQALTAIQRIMDFDDTTHEMLSPAFEALDSIGPQLESYLETQIGNEGPCVEQLRSDWMASR